MGRKGWQGQLGGPGAIFHQFLGMLFFIMGYHEYHLVPRVFWGSLVLFVHTKRCS